MVLVHNMHPGDSVPRPRILVAALNCRIGTGSARSEVAESQLRRLSGPIAGADWLAVALNCPYCPWW